MPKMHMPLRIRVRALLAACVYAILAVAVIACASSDAVEQTAAAETTAIKVFYGTNRNRRDETRPGRFYGEDRGSFEMGVATVSFAVPEEKVQLVAVKPRGREDFLDDLRTALAQAPKPEILLFVHGYLRSFRQVAKLMAEFTERTGFDGVPVIWSWPSTTNPARYTVDETNAAWAEADFARFLDKVIAVAGARTVHLVGHSLGARSLTSVTLTRLLPGGTDPTPIGEFVLLAPDVDQEIFKRDAGPALVRAGLSVTLYTAANDKAMASARAIHGNRRAGDSGGGPVLVPGIETIDVTSANRSILGHSYFDESESVSRDLALLLNERLRAADRPDLVPVDEAGQRYWLLYARE